MSTDFFIGFWSGAFAILFVGISLIWSVDETKDGDDDDYHYEPFDDDHIQPA